jgi:hypothetical protein
MNKQEDEARRQEETQKLINTLAGFSNVPGEGLPPTSSHSEDNPLNASCPSLPTPLALPPSEVILLFVRSKRDRREDGFRGSP